MALEARRVGIVVIANVHNPSILNPDFLLRNNIIPDNWGTPADVASLPAYSTVKYPTRGIQIACQEERLQFEKQFSDEAEFDELVDCASKYVRVLEHVQYRAVAVNCDFQFHRPEVATWAKSRFLSSKLLTENPDITNCRAAFRFEPDRDATLIVEFRPLVGERRVRVITNYQYSRVTSVPKLVELIAKAPSAKSESERRALELIGEAA